MTNKHTPGPWRAIPDGASNAWSVIAPPLSVCEVNTVLNAPTEANARLIAAAPDLLAVAQLASAAIDYALAALNAPEECQMQDTAKALWVAIKKAKGE